jgi:DNA helicase II / ATP-dependent DNA helicase PcrA
MNKQSDQQTEIINAIAKIILVIACAGSGKTQTIINKYIYNIINNIIKPEETIMITFTKKAGIEMLNRIKLYMPDKLPFHVGTIHGLCYKILSLYQKMNLTIIDDVDSNVIISNINNNHLTNVKSIIDQASTYYPFNLIAVLSKYNKSHQIDQYTQVYKKYQSAKRKERLIDFNDLMLMFCNFLNNKKSINFKNKLKYIFFDEYQDINMIQNYILKKLVSKSDCRLMLVGDDSQSIYSFRGSSVEYILNFNKYFKDGKIYILSTNYRSSESIVKLSQDIINKNKVKYEKNIIAVNSNSNDDLQNNNIGFKNSIEQYKWVIEDIIKKNNSGISFDNMVIIARTNKILDTFENFVSKNYTHIHNKITKNDSILLQKDYIKMFFAFIICTINPKSIIHLERIKLLDNSNYLHISKLFKSIKKMDNNYDKINKIILYLSDYYDENIINNIKNIIPKNLNDEKLKDLINNIYLNDNLENNLQGSKLLLTTAHSSKGLEWEYVYIIDMNAKDFPSIWTKNVNEIPELLEEERRLFYVAVSRAKKSVNITYHNKSQFISELNL